MTLGEYAKILHSYIGVDRDNYEFIVYLCTLIMRQPHTSAEKKADEEEKYYPYYGKDKAERDYLGRIYNGSRNIPKQKARTIKSRYFPKAFKEEFSILGKTAREGMVADLAKHNVSCTIETLPQICVDLISLFIDAAVMGISEIDASLVGDEKELTIPVYDDSELKKKYGVHLLAETKQLCPYDRCFKPLYQDDEGRSAFDYSVVQINPRLKQDTADNLIALCPECARKYMFSLTQEKVERLEDIKLKLSSLMESMEFLSEEKIVSGVERVLEKIADIPFDKVIALKYDPTQVIEKMDKTDPALYIEIRELAGRYYPDVDAIFKQMATEHLCDYDKFCFQMKFQYKALAEQGALSQREIFDGLSNWMYETTHEEMSFCKVVVSFFVQKCEVFDVISE